MGKFPFNVTQGVILCKAKIANQRRSLFLKLAVDTGASFTMISIESALAIGIVPSETVRHIEITTANGVVLAPIVRIPSFTCFGIEIKNMEVVCHNLPTESPVEGLLGLDFLRKSEAILDFSQNTIHVTK